jgi:hypothetical protein
MIGFFLVRPVVGLLAATFILLTSSIGQWNKSVMMNAKWKHFPMALLMLNIFFPSTGLDSVHQRPVSSCLLFLLFDSALFSVFSLTGRAVAARKKLLEHLAEAHHRAEQDLSPQNTFTTKDERSRTTPQSRRPSPEQSASSPAPVSALQDPTSDEESLDSVASYTLDEDSRPLGCVCCLVDSYGSHDQEEAPQQVDSPADKIVVNQYMKLSGSFASVTLLFSAQTVLTMYFIFDMQEHQVSSRGSASYFKWLAAVSVVFVASDETAGASFSPHFWRIINLVRISPPCCSACAPHLTSS